MTRDWWELCPTHAALSAEAAKRTEEWQKRRSYEDARSAKAREGWD